jgi:hypothetical protein
MHRSIRTAVLTALLCLGASAHAQTSGTNTVERNGYYFNSTTGNRTDADGRVYVTEGAPAHTSSVATNAGLNGVALASGQAKQALSAVPVGDWGKFDLLISWTTAAAADSDSVAIAVKVYGKTSATAGDGLNFLISPKCHCSADTASVVLPAGVAAIARKVPPTALILSPHKVHGGSPHLSLKVDGTARAVAIPFHRVSLVAGSNGILLNMADAAGDFSFPYALVELANWGNTNLTNVTATWWPRAQ